MGDGVVYHVPWAIVFLFWYGITTSLAQLNYSIWIRFQDSFLDEDLINTYLAFCIIGLVAYVFGGGPMFFTGFKYATTQQSRSRRIRIGMVIMYFASTLPLFIMDLFIVWRHGVLNVLQGLMFVLQLVAWTTGSFAVWFIYMWAVASFIHARRGGGRELMYRQPPVTTIGHDTPPPVPRGAITQGPPMGKYQPRELPEDAI